MAAEIEHLEAVGEITLRPGDGFLMVNDDPGWGLWVVTGVEHRDGWVPRVYVEPGVVLASGG